MLTRRQGARGAGFAVLSLQLVVVVEAVMLLLKEGVVSTFLG